MRGYEVYQPKIQRGYVVESTLDGLAYNHCPTVMWFKGRWFCAWNGNDRPIEAVAGLQIHMSTSVDGRHWSAPFAAFSDPQFCENPYRLVEARQWQPVSMVVGGELWCFFWQDASGRDDWGSIDTSRRGDWGLMFGRLKEPDGKWTVRRLELGDGGGIELLGRTWSFFTAQNGVQLRSGRVLVPLTLVSAHTVADVAEDAPDLRRREKRATVIYSDDGGATWQVSPGCGPKDRTWRPWEPTVWEQSDGSVAMIFKNNSHPSFASPMPRPSEFLFRSMSRDGGETWAEPEFLPIESVSSRMYVFPVDGEGVWRAVDPASDGSARLWLMVQNDYPGGAGWQQDRRDLALFFKRGDGFEFTAGPVFSGWENRVCYAQAAAHDGSLVITYTQSFLEKRSIRYAHVSPLPDESKRYLLPRADVQRTPRPRQEGGVLRFEGAQHLNSRNLSALSAKGLALAAWIRPDSSGTLLDARQPSGTGGGGGGLSWGIGVIGPEWTPVMSLRLSGHPPFHAALPIRQGEWMYAGVDLDQERGLLRFHVDGRSMELALPEGFSWTGREASACIGSGSGVPYFGDVRFLGLFDGPLTPSAHHALHDDFAGEFQRPALGDGTEPLAKKLLWLDPSAPDFLNRFVLPDDQFQGVRTALEEGMGVLRFTGEGSAGVDVDANHRAGGDAVTLRFRFKPLRGERLVLCTVGDANEAARVLWERGIVKLTAGKRTAQVGRASLEAWSELEIHTAGGVTEASVNGGSLGRVNHRPKGTWVYLGQGYRTGGGSADESFLVEVGSVQSQVRVAD